MQRFGYVKRTYNFVILVKIKQPSSMNKFVTLLALVTILSLSAKAQEPQNVIKANPLGFFVGTADIGYERALTEKSSIEITPSFGDFNFGGFKYTSLGFGAR
jgi:hypothetical protein